MVWFQCDDCGENLKKPKLANHFNRCSAHKLSCIDCGVVFDQHSVQAHTSCVSEVEKYGPKGVSKPANASASKPKNGKAQNGPDVDLSRGLTQRPPWSCTLCNVKATSWETLETHAQGKKHRSKAKSAAVKDAPLIGAGAVVDTVEVDNSLSAGTIGSLVSKCSAEASSQPPEKKRKNEQVDGPLEAEQELKSKKKDKKASKEYVNSEPHGASPGSPRKKRKHLEEEQHQVIESKVSGKKSKRKDEGSAPEENGHFGTVLKVANVEGLAEEENKKDKKQKRGKKGREESLNCIEGPKFAVENGSEDALVNGASSPHDADSDRERLTPVTFKKVKKAKFPDVVEEPVTPEAPVTSQNKHKTSGSRSGRNEETPRKEKETLIHEVSFREWLGDDDTGGNGGTPTHPPILNKGDEDTSTGPKGLDSEQLHAVSKVVKWKKIISEALGKSLDGRMKRKDLSKAVLTTALKAAEASSIPVDRMVLKEELMRQIKSNSKFVLDGKYVVLASGGK